MEAPRWISELSFRDRTFALLGFALVIAIGLLLLIGLTYWFFTAPEHGMDKVTCSQARPSCSQPALLHGCEQNPTSPP